MADGSKMTRFNPLAGRSFDQAMQDFEDAGGAAPVIGEDGSMQIGDVTLLPTGLRIAGSIDEGEWLRVGGLLRKLQTSLQWLIGDWLLYGEREYGKTYEEIAALCGYEVVTITDFVYVAGHVKFSVRTENLSFGHHKLVAALDAGEQRQWLRLAVDKKYSVAALRRAMLGLPESKPANGVARLVQHEMSVRQRFEREARTKQADKREALRAFAQVQAEYWKSAVEALSESKGE